jgi:hypothetical protein
MKAVSLIIALGVLAAATPVKWDDHQIPWSSQQAAEPIDEEMVVLLNKYAPIIKLSYVLIESVCL